MFYYARKHLTYIMPPYPPNPKKILSPLPQKASSKRVHATARFVHDDDTTVTDHTDQEAQFSFGAS